MDIIRDQWEDIKIKIKNDEGKLLDDGSFTFYRTGSAVVK